MNTARLSSYTPMLGLEIKIYNVNTSICSEKKPPLHQIMILAFYIDVQQVLPNTETG